MKEIYLGMVKNERVAWVSAFVISAIAVYYFWNAPISLEGSDLYSRDVRRIAMNCFGLMVVGEILIAIVSRKRSGVTEEDERDDRIADRATKVAYRTMIGFLVLLIGRVVFHQGLQARVELEHAERIHTLGELGMANILLGILIISSLANHIAKIVYYRRGY